MEENRNLDDLTIMELLALKEEYRSKHGLYIENTMGERGSMNHKTKPYWSCDFTMRIKHPTKKNQRFNARISCQTFDSYRKALVFSLMRAERVVQELKDSK